MPKYTNRLKHKSHYENVPFEVPEGWCWVKIRDLCYYLGGYAFKSTQYVASSDNQVIRIGNVKDDKILFESQPVFITDDYAVTAESALLKNNDLLFTMTGTKGKRDYFKTSLVRVGKKRLFLNQRVGCLRSYSTHVYMEYLCLAMKHTCVLDAIFQTETGNVSQGNIGSENTLDLLIPLPSLNEQKRIVQRFQDCISDIDSVELNTIELKKVIERLKSKILDLAIHGKLVPQDPNDEPASELLKRINPKFVPCDNPHYEQVPDGWCVCTLEDIVDYEQPQAYIVHSTDYSDSYKIPVLTAGKSFIIGYTNELDGICDNVPVIIFDDFTTDSKYVDFPFKVKSSAMKILHVKEGINIKYVAYFMSITRLIGDTHKRYWISEYSKVNIPLPPKAEQDRIVTQIERLMCSLDSIAETLV